ncbi:hypothetical protein EDD36DRAFT_65174 [Exophiala viscosa]|uniref:Secreted protein n=1 Tax=Exophiala viscosa TaxID=2486360 RepID=A0AAN6I9L2_9EURO|nr:hypothetical protein EDD36DRAFT_65174 [Exophiala viscosa]
MSRWLGKFTLLQVLKGSRLFLLVTFPTISSASPSPRHKCTVPALAPFSQLMACRPASDLPTHHTRTQLLSGFLMASNTNMSRTRRLLHKPPYRCLQAVNDSSARPETRLLLCATTTHGPRWLSPAHTTLSILRDINTAGA